MEKVWEIKDPDTYPTRKMTVTRPEPPPVVEKDPAKAYSLSLFCWGGGRLYNDQLVSPIPHLPRYNRNRRKRAATQLVAGCRVLFP